MKCSVVWSREHTLSIHFIVRSFVWQQSSRISIWLWLLFLLVPDRRRKKGNRSSTSEAESSEQKKKSWKKTACLGRRFTRRRRYRSGSFNVYTRSLETILGINISNGYVSSPAASSQFRGKAERLKEMKSGSVVAITTALNWAGW